MPLHIGVLFGEHAGQPAWVIGCGPSLRNLTAAHIGDGPVIVINDAILHVDRLSLTNPVYSLQKDLVFAQTEAPILAHAHESAPEFGETAAYVFSNPGDFQVRIDLPSLPTALEIARVFGCKHVNYLCCDACADGSTGRWSGEPKNPQNYGVHCGLVAERADRRGMTYAWQVVE